MATILLIYFIGLNIVPIIFQKFDIWVSQSFWSQITAVFLLFYQSINPAKRFLEINKPLFFFCIWALINTAFWTYMSATKDGYTVSIFLMFFNIICAYSFYTSIIQYLNIENIKKITIYLKYIVLTVLFICVLQYFGLGQIFVLLDPKSKYFNNLVCGTMGQPTQLSSFLAMCIPLFLYESKRQDYLSLGLMAIILLFFTGTTKGDPAVSGMITAALTSLFFLFYKNRKSFFIVLGVFTSLIISYFILATKSEIRIMFSDHARMEVWEYYFGLFQKYAITGTGLNIINQIAPTSIFPTAHHLHLELYQIALELGVVGFILALWLLKEFFEMPTNSQEGLVYKSVFFGFFISSFFNYPMHIWYVCSVAILSYSIIYCLNHKENIDASID